MREPTVVLTDTGSDGLKYPVGSTSTRIGTAGSRVDMLFVKPVDVPEVAALDVLLPISI